MRSVYDVWQKPTPNARYEKAGTFDDLPSAKRATGVPDFAEWREVENRHIPSGADGVFVSVEQAPDTTEDRVTLALDLIGGYGGIDGSHHKMWVLDQAARILAGDGYEAWAAEQRDGEDGPDTYEWDEGIAP